MKPVSEEIQYMSIVSLESTYTKLLHAHQSTVAKGSSTTRIAKRLRAVKIGLDSVKEMWRGERFEYDEAGILASKQMLKSILPSIEQQIAKAKQGSPQKTLNEHRLTALQLAIESLKSRLH
ncbi:hypothetical protein [Paenibacillus campi]|uniref:hypothetical protein n=1 Tax=Paenibacillus campi TaxID=3106031 RepID=UPI002AFDFEA5|nr:hypothetical protein [Paenibacillus sp. SGZ-1009]